MNSNFLLFGQERSGSTSLISSLNSNCGVVHEPLSSLSGDIKDNSKFIEIVNEFDIHPNRLEESDIIPYFNKYNYISTDQNKLGKFFDRLYEEFYGLKHIWCTVPDEGNENVIKYCDDRKIPIIFLYRENSFDAAVSWQLGNQTGVWQLGDSFENRKKLKGFNYKPLIEQQIKRRVLWYERSLKKYLKLCKKPYVVSYEQIYEATTTERKKLMLELLHVLDSRSNHLNISNYYNFLFPTESRKINNRNVYKSIPNYEEMKCKYGEYKIKL